MAVLNCSNIMKIASQIHGPLSPKHLKLSDARFLSNLKHQASLRESYQTLGVSEDCEDETLRLAFIDLAKRFHPDGGTTEANAYKFTEIAGAYRDIQNARSIQREREHRLGSNVEEFDIKHTAPQHRHYLAHDVGIGTPSKRERLHAIERAQKAAENVMEHRLKKLQATERNTLVGMNKQHAKKIKTHFGMDRLVEDLIQEAMNKGEFSKLAGAGKPLENDVNIQNPYVDFVTHKLNQVLKDNGFTPEWIQLFKEIREEKQTLHQKLIKARNNLGPTPLSPADSELWQSVQDNLKAPLKKLNDKINKYNLLVPLLQKQMLQVSLNNLAEEVLARPPVKNPENINKSLDSHSNNVNSSNESLFSMFFSIFNRNNS